MSIIDSCLVLDHTDVTLGIRGGNVGLCQQGVGNVMCCWLVFNLSGSKYKLFCIGPVINFLIKTMMVKMTFKSRISSKKQQFKASRLLARYGTRYTHIYWYGFIFPYYSERKFIYLHGLTDEWVRTFNLLSIVACNTSLNYSRNLIIVQN